MLKKSITYINPFTEEEVTEEHFFHISKADLVEMEVEEHGATYVKDGKTFTGMQAKLQRIVDSQDGKAILVEFKDIIRRSYGKRDGDRFLKSSAIWEDFASTEAFSQLLFELCTDAEAAAAFTNGVVPGNLEQIAEEVRAQAVEESESKVPSITKAEEAATDLGARVPGEPQLLTQAEVREMDSDELKSGLASGKYKLS